jgi:hypothetical protein
VPRADLLVSLTMVSVNMSTYEQNTISNHRITELEYNEWRAACRKADLPVSVNNDIYNIKVANYVI